METHERYQKKIEIRKKIPIVNIIGSYLDEFLRCEYRLIKSIQEGTKPMDFLSSEFVKAYVIKPGVEFEKQIMSEIEWKQTDLPLHELMKQKTMIQKPLIILNNEKIKEIFSGWLKYSFIGEPDIILPISGGFYAPLDIKHHRKLNRIDKLRITYYSLLLKSKFGYKKLPPGYILLKDKKIERVDTKKHIEEVLEILKSIDSYLIDSHLDDDSIKIEPRLCKECSNCIIKKECVDYLKRNRGLTLVHQVGPENENTLKDFGIKKIDQLAKLHPKEIEHLDLRSFFGAKTHQIICASARSIAEFREVKFGNERLPSNTIELFLDLEYDDNKKVFCHGIAIRKNEEITYKLFFEEGKKFDTFLRNFLKKEKNFVLYTYAGNSADMPILKEKKDYYNILSVNHIDLYRFICRNIAYPVQSYSEKELAEHFGIDVENSSSIKDGFGCIVAYGAYLMAKGKEKQQIKKDILTYNKSDLIGLIKIKDLIAKKIEKLPLEYSQDHTESNKLTKTKIALIRNYYEQNGLFYIKFDKRYNKTYYEIRLRFYDIDLMTKVKAILQDIGFSVGKPYQRGSMRTLYLYGETNVRKFKEIFKPKKKLIEFN